MKKFFVMFLATGLLAACNNATENKSDNEKAKSEAADTVNLIDHAQEKVNEAIDTAQSKGGKLLEEAGDSLKHKVIEPFKKDAKKVGEKVKEKVQEIKEKVEQE